MDTNAVEMNSKLVGANVRLRHQNAELRRWCAHLRNVVASQQQQIESVQADLENVRTERDNLLAAGRHFDAIVHQGLVCTAPPPPPAELVPRPASRLNIPLNGGEIDRTVSGIWLDGLLNPRTDCSPTTRSPFEEFTAEEKQELKIYLLTHRGPASARGGSREGAFPLATSSTGSPESSPKANIPTFSPASSSRSSGSSHEACVPRDNTSALVTSTAGAGSPISAPAPKANVAPDSPEEVSLIPSTEASGKCSRTPNEANVDDNTNESPGDKVAVHSSPYMSASSSRSSGSSQEACVPRDNTSALLTSTAGRESPTSGAKANIAPDLPDEVSLMLSTESSGKCSKPPDEADVDDTTNASHGDEVAVQPGPFISGALRSESSSTIGDDLTGWAGPGSEIDGDCLEEGAKTETDEPGPTENESETHRSDLGGNRPDGSETDDCRSECSTEEEPKASSPQRPNAQTFVDQVSMLNKREGDDVGTLDSLNSAPVSEARDPRNENLVAGSGSAADPLKIEDSYSGDPCDDSGGSAESRRLEPSVRSTAVITSRPARPVEQESSKYALGKLQLSVSRASSAAWSSRYPYKLYSRDLKPDSGTCGARGKRRQERVDPEESGGNETDIEDETSSDRYTHVTHCCWCYDQRLQSQAVALCERCPRIMCRRCTHKAGLRVPSREDSRDVILPASSCRCLQLDSEFPKPPPNAQPEAHLLKHLRRHDLSLQFRKPVDIESNPDYLSVITYDKMMDLVTMAKKMRKRRYVTTRGQRKFLLDLQQIWSNCWKYAQYDPKSKAPISGIVSCTLILANMVDEYCRSNMEVPTLILDDKSWLAARQRLKQTRFCEMVKGKPRNATITSAINARQGFEEEHQRENDNAKVIQSSESGSAGGKRKLSGLPSAGGDSSGRKEVVSRTLCDLADVGDRLVQQASKKQHETRSQP